VHIFYKFIRTLVLRRRELEETKEFKVIFLSSKARRKINKTILIKFSHVTRVITWKLANIRIIKRSENQICSTASYIWNSIHIGEYMFILCLLMEHRVLFVRTFLSMYLTILIELKSTYWAQSHFRDNVKNMFCFIFSLFRC